MQMPYRSVGHYNPEAIPVTVAALRRSLAGRGGARRDMVANFGIGLETPGHDRHPVNARPEDTWLASVFWRGAASSPRA